MTDIKKGDIEHLAELARIELADDAIETLQHEVGAILDYVDQLNDIVATKTEEKTVGPHANVFREDIDPHEPGIYTENLLSGAPKRQGVYLRVKKILNNDQ